MSSTKELIEFLGGLPTLRISVGNGTYRRIFTLTDDGKAKLKQIKQILEQQAQPDRDLILQAVARGWCTKENEHKIMDSTLAVAIAEEIRKLLVGGKSKGEKQ